MQVKKKRLMHPVLNIPSVVMLSDIVTSSTDGVPTNDAMAFRGNVQGEPSRPLIEG